MIYLSEVGIGPGTSPKMTGRSYFLPIGLIK